MSENWYPAKIDLDPLKNCDVLFVGSIMNESELNSSSWEPYNYDKALVNWMTAVNGSFGNSLMESKVLLPIHPLKILDLMDLLILKLNNLAHINVFSHSAK